jgi:uncharacterized membrane protein YtjA (UPF0391 family)
MSSWREAIALFDRRRMTYVRLRTDVMPSRLYIPSTAWPLRHIAHDAACPCALQCAPLPESGMLHNALVFLVAAVVAGLFGFTRIVGTPFGVAKILCLTFAILCIVSLYLMRRARARARAVDRGRAEADTNGSQG